MKARERNTTDDDHLANENLDFLIAKFSNNSAFVENKPSYFTCGENKMKEWYLSKKDEIEDNYYGNLVPMVINFYIATEANVFIGVNGSSFSNDVWITRYYQGKGNTNYQYTPQGIIPVPNGGLSSFLVFKDNFFIFTMTIVSSFDKIIFQIESTHNEIKSKLDHILNFIQKVG